MKNITNVKEISFCDYCDLKGFFCRTPCGADFTTCPCCGGDDYVNNLSDSDYDAIYENENDMRIEYKYCNKCKIIFELGCTHAAIGCTDNVYNAHFIKKWKDKITNIEYEGMPEFDDENDWFNNVNNIQVLQIHCPHIGAHCSKTRHPVTEYCNIKRNKK